MTSSPEVWEVVTTCPDAETAGALAERLVREGLAACAQVGAPVTSRYLWEGELVRAAEIPLVLKVCGDRLPACLERLRAWHPYQVPQLLAWPCPVVDPAYRDWACGGEGEP